METIKEFNEAKCVDIIIPVYNAYQELVVCLESIYKNTNLNINRLILINDNSTDERILPYLEKQKQKNVLVFHNASNQGFSNNINIGMKQSEVNDVILLNSDTIVTDGWVKKICNCAYSDETIATVTPVSNNATLCSVPIFCEENQLPNYLSVDQAGYIVEKCSMKKYPRITTAHGFCMFIKREVINNIGYFDAETFGRGYGEENDFCNRAEQAGYHHVMCDDTYIYHSGTKSFVSKEKEQYIMVHDRILRDRYPAQMHANDIHVRDNPNSFVGNNISIYFDLENGKKNILYLVQSDFRKGATDNLGGTQFHVRDLMLGLREKYNIFVAARNGEYLNLTAYYGECEKEFRFYIGAKKSIYEFRNKVMEKIWRNILSAFHIDLVHVHHTINASFDIFYVSDEFGIPIVFTAHDFYFICPSVKMLGSDDVVCVGKNTDRACRECLNSRLGITDKINYIKIWRVKCAHILSMCKAVIVPDESIVDMWLLYYPFVKEKIIIIEHGYDMTQKPCYDVECSNDVINRYEEVEKEGFTYKITGWAYLGKNKGNAGEKIYLHIQNESGREGLIPASKKARPDVIENLRKMDVGYYCIIPQNLLDGGSLKVRVALEDDGKLIYAADTFVTPKLPQTSKKLNIAFIGGLNKSKGGKVISAIINSLHKDVNWYIFGGIGVSELTARKQNNLVKTGKYVPEDLPVLLKSHEIDVVGILSIWPETYSYTLTEALLNRIPVIVTDIGALGRRVGKLKCGWRISVDHAEYDFIKIVNNLIKDRRILGEFEQEVAQLKFPSVKMMTDHYSRIYEKLWNVGCRYSLADYEFIYKGHTMVSAPDEQYGIFQKEDASEEKIDCYFKFKRYLENTHPRAYIVLRKLKGYFSGSGCE